MHEPPPDHQAERTRSNKIERNRIRDQHQDDTQATDLAIRQRRQKRLVRRRDLRPPWLRLDLWLSLATLRLRRSRHGHHRLARFVLAHVRLLTLSQRELQAFRCRADVAATFLIGSWSGCVGRPAPAEAAAAGAAAGAAARDGPAGDDRPMPPPARVV